MSACPACDHPDRGYAHTCAASGTFLAAEAHDGDHVLEPAELHRFDVALRFRIAASGEQHARTILTGFVTMLLDEDAVSETEFTITEQAKVDA